MSASVREGQQIRQYLDGFCTATTAVTAAANWTIYHGGRQFAGSVGLAEAYLPLFWRLRRPRDDAIVARWSANPLGMLCPELGARITANVAVAQDFAGNLKPAKDKSTDRIDGIVALIMAIARAMVAQEEPQPEYQVLVF